MLTVYRGGSLTADFLSDKHPSIRKDQIIATVRSKGQVDTLAKLGIPVLQLDLADEKAVAESILLHNGTITFFNIIERILF
jgi:hypothetical protein